MKPKQILIAAVIILLTIGVISMAIYQSGVSKFKYEKYSSKDQELGFTMDYPSGWNSSEHRGSYGNYAQAQFYDPTHKGVGPTFVINVKRSLKITFNPPNLQGMREDLLQKRLKFKEAKVLSESKTNILKEDAIDILLSYMALDKLYSVDAKLIPVKERIVLIKKADKFYTLRYQSTAEEFDKFDKAFYYCIKTIRFKENQ